MDRDSGGRGKAELAESELAESPSIIGVGEGQLDCLPQNLWYICKHVEQVVLCLRFLLGELTALLKPSCYRVKWGGKGNGERGGGKREERKGKKGIGKRGVALAP